MKIGPRYILLDAWKKMEGVTLVPLPVPSRCGKPSGSCEVSSPSASALKLLPTGTPVLALNIIWAIAWRHVLPNILSPLLIQGTIQFAVAILAEAGLSYLGLGTQPPHASWGRMLNEAQTFMALSPWMAIFPGVAIAWAVLGLNLLGDGLRDTLDPRMVRIR